MKLKNTMTELKISEKSFNSRLAQRKQRISEFKDKLFEIKVRGKYEKECRKSMGVKRYHQNNLCALKESQTEQRKKKGLFIYLRNYRLKSSQSGDRRGNGHPKSESLKDPTRQQTRPHQTLELKYKPPKISKSCIN